MPKLASHGIVIGFHRDDHARHAMIPPADIYGGDCLSCGCRVFVNTNGASALRERDADVICRRCDKSDGPQIDRSLIES